MFTWYASIKRLFLYNRNEIPLTLEVSFLLPYSNEMVDRPAAYRPSTKKSTLLRPEIYAEKPRNSFNPRNTGRKLIVCIDGTSNQYSEKVRSPEDTG